MVKMIVTVALIRTGWAVICHACILMLRAMKNRRILREKRGSWAIVTGCTDGIGLNIAKEFAKSGVNLILVSRSEDKLAAVKEELSKKVEVETISIDFKQEVDFKKAFSNVQKKKEVDILVNNVGMVMMRLPNIHEYTEEQETDIIKVNLINTLRMTREYLSWSRKPEREKYVLTVGSMLGLMPSPCMSIYAGTKAFLQVWSESVAAERNKGYHFEVLMTGLVATKLSKVRRASLFTPSAELYGRLCVHSFGLSIVTYPYLFHWLQSVGIELIPRCFMAGMIAAFSFVMRRKIAKKKEAASAQGSAGK